MFVKRIDIVFAILITSIIFTPIQVKANAILLRGVPILLREVFEILGAGCTIDAIKSLVTGDSIGRNDIVKLKKELDKIKKRQSELTNDGELSPDDSQKVNRVISILENSIREADRKVSFLEKQAKRTNSDIKKIKIKIKDIDSIMDNIRSLNSRIDTLECDQRLIGDASYQGKCKNGLPDGYGVISFPNGQMYKGFFKKGLRNGRGTHLLPNGDKIEGIWMNGELTE
jgi:hypothetical protein